MVWYRAVIKQPVEIDRRKRLERRVGPVGRLAALAAGTLAAGTPAAGSPAARSRPAAWTSALEVVARGSQLDNAVPTV